MTKVKRGILFTFSVKTEKFKTPSERTTFFRKLYGWKQVVTNDEKTYEYERPGIIDDVPHEKVDQSSFIVPEHDIDEIMDFFEHWSNKVMFRTFKVLLDDDISKMFDEFEVDE
ncbi:hypothetical protein EPN87_03765 [archaeon]|nr:MAG: hypothetical protein EPN87_03765 [archaeon]